MKNNHIITNWLIKFKPRCKCEIHQEQVFAGQHMVVKTNLGTGTFYYIINLNGGYLPQLTGYVAVIR